MTVTATWTEFLRDPNGVMEKMEEEGEVILLRRSAPSVRLSDAAADESYDAILAVLAQLITLALDDGLMERLVGRLSISFPWVTLLPVEDRETFVHEFLAEARAGIAVGRMGAASRMLEAWKETAAAYADPRICVDGSDLEYFEDDPTDPDSEDVE
ncbi:hypothetical protein [Nocardia sp. XZ_19_385]|uniref:hypothetical protein n=1 Tax=Nocardia sp. XZ_19_385 TaxID=2769488 RepID=UPI00188EA85B|nr:hypothetical protein [Nocardia sp. XZ_19_385]